MEDHKPMSNQKKIVEKEVVFENTSSKNIFKQGLKYLGIALPLLFFSPIIVTIGFKAINNGKGYLLLVLGCLLILVTIVLVIQAFRLILKSLFNK
jgi:phosphotransferase system  glucose/maltose/N-acetylglucosamine-specific IIC component